MKIYQDLDTLTVNTDAQAVGQISGIEMKRGITPLEITFQRSQVAKTIGTALAGQVKFVLKELNKFDGDPIAQVTGFTAPTLVDPDFAYTANLQTDTDLVRGLMFVDGNPTNDVTSLDCMGEILWRPTGADEWIPGNTILVKLNNRVSQDGDLDPVGASDPARAPLDSPHFTGIPEAPTAAPGTNTDQLATTAFVHESVSGLGDNDPTLAANSDTLFPTQSAVKAYADSRIAASDAMVFKNVIDCSSNPNYPAADVGHTYRVSVPGTIGGGAGEKVEVGDLLMCIVDGTPSGDQAAVGANWTITQTNTDGTVMGPGSSSVGNLVAFDSTNGKVIRDSGLNFDTDPTLADNSDAAVPSQAAVKAYVDAHAGGGGGSSINWLIKAADYNAVSGDRILADTRSAPFSITLPATPVDGDQVIVLDAYGSFSTNALTLQGIPYTIIGTSIVAVAIGGVWNVTAFLSQNGIGSVLSSALVGYYEPATIFQGGTESLEVGRTYYMQSNQGAITAHLPVAIGAPIRLMIGAGNTVSFDVGAGGAMPLPVVGPAFVSIEPANFNDWVVVYLTPNFATVLQQSNGGGAADGGGVDITGLGSVNLSEDKTLSISGIQVVCNQQAAISDADDGTVLNYVEKINAILAVLRTHGLIGT